MKTIIAGSRDLTEEHMLEALDACPFISKVTTVVSGTARGIDRSGEDWAKLNNMPIVRFPADWARFKQGAGRLRNKEMAEFADALIAVWDGKSPGTKNMIGTAKGMGLYVYVYNASTKDGWIE